MTAGRVTSTKNRPGNRYLKGALGIAALSVVRGKDTGEISAYRRRRGTVRRGPMRALVSVEHAMVIAAWHMFTHGEFYREPVSGLLHSARSRPGRARASLNSNRWATRSPSNHSPTPADNPTSQRPNVYIIILTCTAWTAESGRCTHRLVVTFIFRPVHMVFVKQGTASAPLGGPVFGSCGLAVAVGAASRGVTPLHRHSSFRRLMGRCPKSRVGSGECVGLRPGADRW